jgi:hypothetical protein
MKKIVFLTMIGSFILAACSGGAATPTPDTSNIPVVTDNFSVVAEGRLLPAEYANISLPRAARLPKCW